MGQIVGGSGVILLSAFVPFEQLLLVIASILAVMLYVALPLREPETPVQAEGKRSGLAAVKAEGAQLCDSGLQCLPRLAGSACGVDLRVATGRGLGNVAVAGDEPHGRVRHEQARAVAADLCFHPGGRFGLAGRRISGRSVRPPQDVGPIHRWQRSAGAMDGLRHAPTRVDHADRPERGSSLHRALLLIVSYWAVSLLISAFQGLLYTTRSALFMDICTPAVAATQFTAYVAMVNLTVVYSSAWQGRCLAKLGYPSTLAIDALLGMVSLPLLLLMTRPCTSRSEAVAGE